MNCKVQRLALFLIVFLIFSSISAQISVNIKDMYYSSTGESINNCSLIDLKDNTSISVAFFVKLHKDANNAVGNSTLTIYTKKTPTSPKIEKGFETILDNSWPVGYEDYTSQTFYITLNASEFNVNGSSLLNCKLILV